eukprot:GHVT01009647.1.p1 GENE.GHVT01009647.1~~GHVT01009647.1.p1  ORF type:complete len:378 (-),score=91.16 GHVT01009647.1:657-1790(-)
MDDPLDLAPTPAAAAACSSPQVLPGRGVPNDGVGCAQGVASATLSACGSWGNYGMATLTPGSLAVPVSAPAGASSPRSSASAAHKGAVRGRPRRPGDIWRGYYFPSVLPGRTDALARDMLDAWRLFLRRFIHSPLLAHVTRLRLHCDPPGSPHAQNPTLPASATTNQLACAQGLGDAAQTPADEQAVALVAGHDFFLRWQGSTYDPLGFAAAQLQHKDRTGVYLSEPQASALIHRGQPPTAARLQTNPGQRQADGHTPAKPRHAADGDKNASPSEPQQQAASAAQLRCYAGAPLQLPLVEGCNLTEKEPLEVLLEVARLKHVSYLHYTTEMENKSLVWDLTIGVWAGKATDGPFEASRYTGLPLSRARDDAGSRAWL